MPFLLAIVAAVVLTSPFGAVEGKAVSDVGGLTVEITVEVDKTFEAVLVRPFSPFEELPPTSLLAVDADTWRGLVTFPSAEDWSIVFDGIEADGTASRSDTATLTDIGVDPLVVAGEPSPLPRRSIARSTWWLIGGMIAAVAALAVLAWWTFAPDQPDEHVSSTDDPASENPSRLPDQ
jgi:hypothetical protein